MPLRLKIDVGGEHLLPFAKKKLRELKAEMMRLGQRSRNKYVYVTTSETVFIQTQHVFGDVFLDLIRIAAGSIFAQLTYSSILGPVRAVIDQGAGPARVLPPALDGEYPSLYAKDYTSWIGRNRTVVKFGTAYGQYPSVSVSPAFLARFVYDPDGGAYVISDAQNNVVEDYATHVAQLEMYEALLTEALAPYLQTTNYSWFSVFDGDLDAMSIGISAWSPEVDGHKDRNFIYYPPETVAIPEVGLVQLPAMEIEHVVQIVISTTFAAVSVSYLIDRQIEPIFPHHKFQTGTKILIYALDSRYVSLGLSRPAPGDLVNVLNVDLNADLFGNEVGHADNSGEWFGLEPPGVVWGKIGAKGEKFASILVQDANDSGLSRIRLFLNGAQIYQTEDSATDIVSTAPTPSDFIYKNGGLYFMLPPSVDLSGENYTPAIYRNGIVQPLPEMPVSSGPGLMASAVLLGARYVVVSTDVDGNYGVRTFTTSGVEILPGRVTSKYFYVIDWDREDAFWLIEQVPDESDPESTRTQYWKCQLVESESGEITLTQSATRRAPETLNYQEVTATTAQRDSYLPFSVLPGYWTAENIGS